MQVGIELILNNYFLQLRKIRVQNICIQMKLFILKRALKRFFQIRKLICTALIGTDLLTKILISTFLSNSVGSPHKWISELIKPFHFNLGNSYGLQRTRDILKQRATAVYKALKSSNNWQNVQLDVFMKIYPIVRAQRVGSKMNCTISVNIGLVVEAAKRISEILFKFPCRELKILSFYVFYHYRNKCIFSSSF